MEQLLKYLLHLTAELFDIKFAQSADVMYLTHPSHPTKKLSRTGHTAWTLTTVDFTNGPYLDSNTSTTTITASAQLGSEELLQHLLIHLFLQMLID